MYDVLVPVDTDEGTVIKQISAVCALPSAADEVRTIILHVYEDNPEGGSVGRLGSVRRATERLDDAGVAYDLTETSGDPAEQILDAAREYDADCICLGGRQRTPAGKAIFGSVSQSVILQSDRPVLTVPGESD